MVQDGPGCARRYGRSALRGGGGGGGNADPGGGGTSPAGVAVAGRCNLGFGLGGGFLPGAPAWSTTATGLGCASTFGLSNIECSGVRIVT